jgi:biopolymer transport protein ExbD
MAMTSPQRGGVVNQINVTPLVDVVLVLLIIFMVVTPLLQRGKEVTLPKSQSTTEHKEDDGDPLILSVTPDKKFYVEKLEYDEEGLKQKLENELRAKPDRKLLLKGDASVPFGPVRKVMDAARKAGAKGVGLGVEQLKDKQL